MPEHADPLVRLRSEHGLAAPDASHWTFRIAFVTFRLPNFAWRQAAIDAHDRHHIMTGYPLTIVGEIQLAAWEWGAGRYPDWRATAFCAPLLLAGLLAMPKRTWQAYIAGKGQESHYPRRG